MRSSSGLCIAVMVVGCAGRGSRASSFNLEHPSIVRDQGDAAVVSDASEVTLARTPEDVCARLRQRNQDRARAIGEQAVTAIAEWDACCPTAHGAWGFVIDSLDRASESSGEFTLSWSVVHARLTDEADNAPVMSVETDASTHESFDRTIATHGVDYDGDGEEELVLIEQWRAPNTEDEGAQRMTRVLVLTRRGDQIVRYTPSPGDAIVGLAEPHTARPDFIVRDPYLVDSAAGDPVGEDSTAPAFLAHALPNGGFARDDAAAIEFARHQCGPRSPTLRGVAMEPRALVCARMWGAPVAALTREVSRRCTPRRDPRCERLSRYLAVAPPFMLR